MKLCNATMESFIQYISDKNVYIYGLGEYFQRFKEWEIYKCIHSSVIGVIDNGKAGESIDIFDREYVIKSVDCLKSIESGVILICSTKQLDSMYQTLCEKHLSDNIECFVLPLIWAVSNGKDDEDIKRKLKTPDEDKLKIEKKIHCCWFSGETKPEGYQRCIDSWKKVCPDYEIVEWNANNYDCGKNKFVKQAYEKRKWAFISDYARLDILYQCGGIYLDMDVELLKPLDPLLQFDSFFSFDMQNHIDLGSGFGSVRENPFLEDLMEMYRDQSFCDEDGNPMLWKYVQPEYIRGAFQNKGVRMDGNMQLVDGMLILPRSYQAPKDCFLLERFVETEDTMSVHHYNSEWCGKEFLEQRKKKTFWREAAEKLI